MSDRIVALGGGHGLYATLSAARRITPHVTAVVTVADDGGSSGRLRSELDIVPPGDLRMALAALASDSGYGRLWATIFQHRFGGTGALAGHPIGNLLLAGLNEMLADPVAALDELGRILGVKGRVVPMCPIALQIEADVAGLEADPRMSRVIRGQVAVATTPGKGGRVRLLPGDPPGCRCDPGRVSRCARPRFMVHECHSACAGSGARGGAAGDVRAARAGTEPCRRAGGDRRVLRGALCACAVAARPGFPCARDRRRRRTGAGRARAGPAAAHREPSQRRGEVC